MTAHVGRIRLVALVVVSAFVGVVVALGMPKSSVALDPRAADCGLALVGSIKSQVAVDQASDYRKLFPKMGTSPELEDSSPAFFVVYDGPVDVYGGFGAYPPLGAEGAITDGRAVTKVTGVVCAITKYGRIVYTDVDTSK